MHISWNKSDFLRKTRVKKNPYNNNRLYQHSAFHKTVTNVETLRSYFKKADFQGLFNRKGTTLCETLTNYLSAVLQRLQKPVIL